MFIPPPPKLTDAHVARTLRAVPDPGLPRYWTPFTDEEYGQLADRLLAQTNGPLGVFAYGSLIWNPGFQVADQRRGVAHGWHRSFCLEIDHWRGSPELPGLMLALERGGATVGMVLEVARGVEREAMLALLRRELVAREMERNARWITVRTDHGSEQVLTFYAGPRDHTVVSLPIQEQARRLAHACGHGGSGAEYLHKTVQHLRKAGIHDPYLWQLEALVAEEIERNPPLPCETSPATQTQERPQAQPAKQAKAS